MSEKRRKRAKRTALTLGTALAAVPSAHAATFTVSNLNDSGPGSLRQAIEDANAAAGADVIDFQAGLTGTIALTTGQLEVSDSVDIQGPGAASLAVSGNGASRVFYLYNGSALIDVTISGLTITGGNAGDGGGIIDWGENLVLDSVAITGNTAAGEGADGGGLWADDSNDDGMSLTIRDSTVSGNSAEGEGGGIYLYSTGGPVLIQNTVISGNDAGGSGGGIYFYDINGDTTIEDSTISGNSAGGQGGGVYFYDTDGGTHTIRRTTISGNDAVAGGGLFVYGADDPFVIENSTISGNQATGDDGGGIFLYALYGGSFEIRHTTIAGNSASGIGGGVFTQSGPVIVDHSIVGDNTAAAQNDLGTAGDGSFDVSFSLVESPGAANITDNGGNVFNQDPQLGPLQNNGGPTQTQRPSPTSPAVNAGDPAFAPPPSTDQRGSARQIGIIDMGAVELAPGTIQLTFNATSVGEAAGTLTVTATRTGGSDGPVSVSINTADGTATAPADYTAVAGLLSWADGDAAPKSLNVTIVNDLLDEPDETFTVTISGPTGGAVLGSPATAVITILDDDSPAAVVEIPTVGDVGRLLLTALMTLSGVWLLRRKRSAT